MAVKYAVMLASNKDMVRTKAMLHRKGSTSLKTTIPESYALMLELKPGDILEWSHIISHDEVIVRLRKGKSQ
jgi:hypothetical protein